MSFTAKTDQLQTRTKVCSLGVSDSNVSMDVRLPNLKDIASYRLWLSNPVLPSGSSAFGLVFVALLSAYTRYFLTLFEYSELKITLIRLSYLSNAHARIVVHE